MKVGIIILGAFLVLYAFGRILQWYDEERKGNDTQHNRTKVG